MRRKEGKERTAKKIWRGKSLLYARKEWTARKGQRGKDGGKRSARKGRQI